MTMVVHLYCYMLSQRKATLVIVDVYKTTACEEIDAPEDEEHPSAKRHG